MVNKLSFKRKTKIRPLRLKKDKSGRFYFTIGKNKIFVDTKLLKDKKRLSKSLTAFQKSVNKKLRPDIKLVNKGTLVPPVVSGFSSSLKALNEKIEQSIQDQKKNELIKQVRDDFKKPVSNALVPVINNTFSLKELNKFNKNIKALEKEVADLSLQQQTEIARVMAGQKSIENQLNVVKALPAPTTKKTSKTASKKGSAPAVVSTPRTRRGSKKGSIDVFRKRVDRVNEKYKKDLEKLKEDQKNRRSVLNKEQYERLDKKTFLKTDTKDKIEKDNEELKKIYKQIFEKDAPDIRSFKVGKTQKFNSLSQKGQAGYYAWLYEEIERKLNELDEKEKDVLEKEVFDLLGVFKNPAVIDLIQNDEKYKQLRNIVSSGKEEEDEDEDEDEDEEEDEQEGMGVVVKDMLKTGGLTNKFIDFVMRRFPWYRGTVPVDFISEIHGSRDKPFGFIYNLDDSTQKGSHWVAVWLDPVEEKTLEIFDPLADDPTEQALEELKVLIDKLDLDYLLKMKINKVLKQKIMKDGNSSNTCGLHCILFLLQRAMGMPYKESTGWDDAIVSEPKAMKLHKHLIKGGEIKNFELI